MEVIINGFDILENKEVVLDLKFSLVYIGLLLSNCNFKVLWKVFLELKNEVKGFLEDLEIKMVGLVFKEVKEEI